MLLSYCYRMLFCEKPDSTFSQHALAGILSLPRYGRSENLSMESFGMARLTQRTGGPFLKRLAGRCGVSESPAQMRRYHHGDLKSVLVAAGREIMEAGGVRALSLREVARRAGVSHAAPAHHFPSLSAFLSECAASGFGEFADALSRARSDAFDSEEAIAGMGRAYLAFAHRNPVIFRLGRQGNRSACLLRGGTRGHQQGCKKQRPAAKVKRRNGRGAKQDPLPCNG